jgi:hypothetical protein
MELSNRWRLGAPSLRFRGATPLASLAALLLAGCLGADDDDDGPSETCDLPQYGDGTCDPDLACDAPDIDCFRTFSTQSEAESWYAAFEQLLAAEELRPPRAIVPSTDARFPRMRDLLDQGWDAYRARFPLDDLADASPALVLLDDSSINAFVIPDLDSGRSALAVIVHSGVLDAGIPDDDMLGLVMHELAHAVRLHLIEGGKDAVRRFYSVAPDAEEPFGFEQDEDPVARRHGETWRELAGEAGSYSSAELGGFPFLRTELSRVLVSVLPPFVEQHADVCAGPLTALTEAGNDLVGRIDPLDGALALPADSGWPERGEAALAALRDTCMASYQGSFIDATAELLQVTPDEVRASLDPADLALVDGVHLVDAVTALLADRRAGMRAAEQAFSDETGRAWSALRYFSYEEDADDTTVPVLRQMERDPAAGGEFLIGALADVADACRDILDAGDMPGYGADLLDEHHATCWRAFHIRELAARGELRARRVPSTGAPSRRRLRLPPTLRDLVMH